MMSSVLNMVMSDRSLMEMVPSVEDLRIWGGEEGGKETGGSRVVAG